MYANWWDANRWSIYSIRLSLYGISGSFSRNTPFGGGHDFSRAGCVRRTLRIQCIFMGSGGGYKFIRIAMLSVTEASSRRLSLKNICRRRKKETACENMKTRINCLLSHDVRPTSMTNAAVYEGARVSRLQIEKHVPRGWKRKRKSATFLPSLCFFLSWPRFSWL